jgi:aminopeptidase N
MVWILLQIPVGHPADIDEIFDDISYNKGACVIRMLHKYIGDAVSYEFSYKVISYQNIKQWDVMS